MNAVYRWIGYLILFLIVVIFGSGKMRFEILDVPSIGFVALGVLSACLIGMGRDGLRAARRAWSLGERATRTDATAMEQTCGLAVTASWVVGLLCAFIYAIVVLKHNVDDSTVSVSWDWVVVLPLYPLFYATLSVLFFAAHRVRARRWLTMKSEGENENAA